MMTFCEECREMVEYTIEEITMEKEIKGKTIKFNGKEASCNFCGCKVFVPSLRDYNLKQMDDAYRKLENLITVEEIQQILGKYNIGKRPLSELLGWGELTITRYIDGAIPTKQYSEKLFEILNNINSMESILENNNNVLSDLAYKKCKEAILNLRQRSVIPEFEEMKIDSVVKYFLTNLSEVTPLALQKLLYYAQGFYKAFTGEFLFEEDCQAWVHGPVYVGIYHRYKNMGYNPIENEIPYNYCDLNISNIEKEILDSIIINFGCYSGKILEKMTHSEQPWLVTRNGLAADASSNEVIRKDIITNYFEQIKRKYNILNATDIRDYSKDLFEKSYLIKLGALV